MGGALISTAGMTWSHLETSFLECFPPVQNAMGTELQVIRRLFSLRLKVEDLGKLEKLEGEGVYTHIIFSEKVLSLARQAKISNTSMGIFMVHDILPKIIHQDEVFTLPGLIHMESMWNPWNPSGIPYGIHGINVG
jgi:hypothetical protein